MIAAAAAADACRRRLSDAFAIRRHAAAASCFDFRRFLPPFLQLAHASAAASDMPNVAVAPFLRMIARRAPSRPFSRC